MTKLWILSAITNIHPTLEGGFLKREKSVTTVLQALWRLMIRDSMRPLQLEIVSGNRFKAGLREQLLPPRPSVTKRMLWQSLPTTCSSTTPYTTGTTTEISKNSYLK